MRKSILILAAMTLSCAGASAKDAFTDVRCDGDIVKALTGRRLANERAMAIEARHKDIGLEDLGADEVADGTNAISWRICGREFMTLERGATIRDVIEFPAHSKASPAFNGSCQRDGRETKDAIVGVLDGGAGKGDLLPAKFAWRVDAKTLKFVKMDVNGLLCPRSGVITVDGGL